MNREELVELQSDIYSGACKLKELVKSEFKLRECNNVHVCGTCGSSIDLEKNNELCLMLGTPEYKKLMYFCAPDCMEYFSRKLNQTTRGVTGKKLNIRNATNQ